MSFGVAVYGDAKIFFTSITFYMMLVTVKR